MTLNELQAIAADIQTKTDLLQSKVNELKSFIDQVNIQINGPFSPSVNVDSFVTIQTPIYIGYLTAIEAASDALGTDPFH